MLSANWLQSVVPLLIRQLTTLEPPPDLTVSEWADTERQLSREASASPGPWDTSRAEYQRGIMDAVSDPAVHTVVVMSSAQVGKSEILLNATGFYISQDPAPMLLLQPTLEMAEAFSKDRLAPMLRDTPALTGLVADAKSRDSGNTLLHKQFPGGHITLAGANSPASLASRPVRIVFCDEVDRYPPSAGAEGDPVTLARARAKTFWNRKIVLTSTPTIKSVSRIEQAYQESDRRRYWVPCPHCHAEQVLAWKQVRWDTDRPETARYVCEHCGVEWDDAARWSIIRSGEWRGDAPFSGIAGFHLSELYSPWAKLSDIARAFLDAKRSRSTERMRAWVNTSLGESWEDDGERVDETGLADRGEVWDGRPEPVLVVTAGIDVQDDRLEIELVGWGEGEESWSLDYRVIFGDPSAPALWSDLERYLAEHKPHAACIDSGGHYTQKVYDFVRPRYRNRVFAIKGMAGPGRPVWPKKASKQNTGRVNLFLIGVDAAKDVIYGRLRLSTPGAGYCHFPKGRDERYFSGLASETVVTKFSKGFPVREWRKRPGARNEPLDCRVYAYAALCSMNINWKSLARAKQPKPPEPTPEIKTPIEEALPPPVPQRQRPAPRRSGGWVNGWRL